MPPSPSAWGARSSSSPDSWWSPSPGTGAAHNISAIAIIALVSGHLYMAVLNRGMRGALGGIVTGRVDARWAAEHHPAWRPEDPQPSPSSPSTASGSLNGGTR
jgi:cytochrome b subunit of formate dehydrogenase